MKSYHQPVVDLARRCAPKRWRPARSEDALDEQLAVEELRVEQALVEEDLVRDARAGLTPSDMVARKLAYALNGAPVMGASSKRGTRIRLHPDSVHSGHSPGARGAAV